MCWHKWGKIYQYKVIYFEGKSYKKLKETVYEICEKCGAICENVFFRHILNKKEQNILKKRLKKKLGFYILD